MRSPITLNHVDLNLLRIFDLLMQERSVTRAAHRAGRTQSAVSHALNRLRDLFRDELFTRRGGVMEPTPQAKELAKVIAQSLAQIQLAIDRHVHFNPLESQRHFKIGVSDYTGALYLPTLIEEFTQTAPAARLTAVPVRDSDFADHLRRPDTDCIIMGNPTLNDSQMIETVLAQHRMICAGWTGNPDIDALDLETYLALPHLQISADGLQTGVSDHALAAMGQVRNVVAIIPHYIVAPLVLRGTRMITAFADGMMLLMDRIEDIRLVEPPIELPDVRLSLIYDRSRQADAGHIWLRSLIRAVADRLEDRKRAALADYPVAPARRERTGRLRRSDADTPA